MTRVRFAYYILISICTLLILAFVPSVSSQDTPAQVDITYVDLGQFPQLELHLVATSPNGRRFPGLFADSITLTEDGTPRDPSVYDAPRGTAITFLIDADQTAEANWDEIRKAIESYVSLNENWMDEDLDFASIIVATGEEITPLVENTPFRNNVFNAFINDSGGYYQPQFKPVTPLNDLIQQTLNNLSTQAPTPGMYRALVIFSAGDMTGSTQSPEGTVALARDLGIPLFTVLVGQDATGEQYLTQMANNSAGGFFRLDSDDTLIPLWQILSSHRQQYVISFASQIVASGSHTVQVRVNENIDDTESFDITILNPEVEITLPEANAIILREPLESSDQPLDFEPKVQAVKYNWSWPDQLDRSVAMVQLRVNGAVQQQLDLTTSDDRNLIWDIASLQPGPYSLRVEVIDELGLMGQSLEIPVSIQLATELETPEPTPTITPTPKPPIMDTALQAVKRNLPCLAVGGLSLSALLVTFFAFSRRMRYLGTSPLNFLRGLPIFRPLDGLLRSIERVTGPLRLPSLKREKKESKKKESVPSTTSQKPRVRPGVGWVDMISGPPIPSGPLEIRQEMVIGRSREQANMVVSDKTVSRRHARIVPEHGNKYRIYNHSSQSTWVNEQRVPEHGLLLTDGDEIRMGKVTLRFNIKMH